MAQLFFHVDLDAFFASVEQRDNPAYRGKPVIVGAAPGHRGVVSTCSYEARAFGVHSAMPISEAYKRCPKGIYLPVRMGRYAEISRKIMRIFFDFTPDVLQLSIDEALLTMTGTERLWGEPDRAAAMIKRRVADYAGLTVSIGASANKYVAKIASGLRKPDGYLFVPECGEREFMRSLPLSKLWGAGEKTQAGLRAAGISTVGELQGVSLSILEAKFGRAGAAFLHAASLGEDPGIFAGEAKSSSMSSERTFERDTTDREAVRDVLRRIADELAARMCEDDLWSCTLGLKLRYGDFTSITRQTTRADPYVAADEIFKDACDLLDKNWAAGAPIRLVGAGLHNLQKGALRQGSLFGCEDERAEEARRAVQEIGRKGKGTLVRAKFLKTDSHARGGSGRGE
ncbi:DNA polymerase IV [bacterium]|nr:DNA polymerase IV [bacterium]